MNLRASVTATQLLRSGFRHRSGRLDGCSRLDGSGGLGFLHTFSADTTHIQLGMLQAETSWKQVQTVGWRRHDVIYPATAIAMEVTVGKSLRVITQEAFTKVQRRHDTVGPQEFQRVVDRSP